ncbi:MAG TPA: hypothetical protein VG498_19130, partial [Terriglobales bacterium]|nr:hypothetical protein [Terriglobales bacterium]
PPERTGSIGSPTTVVYAPELSVGGILGGIRAGRVFVDLTASKDRLLDFFAQNGTRKAVMGEVLETKSGEVVELSAHVVGSRGSRVRVLVDGKEDSSVAPAAITSADQTITAKWPSDGKRHWLRADVVSSSGKLEVLGNPVYVSSQ